MPARRDLHTGRYNFLHRSWGPLEPFDNSLPEILGDQGVYSHLVTDHQHYWEDGGGTYHTRYDSFDFVRGQEGDPWKGEVRDPDRVETVTGRNDKMARQDWINRKYIGSQDDFPQARTFAAGLEFMERNQREDNWFLQIETFDPHEPFHSPQRFKDLYPHEYAGRHFDWPPYREVQENTDEIEHCRFEYAALVSMCDEYLGRVLDKMDALDLWDDTLLIVTTDHGFMLGEHGWWAKMVMPFYNEIARIPLFMWDPRRKLAGERRQSLTQWIDLMPTILEFFGAPIPPDVQGHVLNGVLDQDAPVRDAALFGIHGGHVNCTDGHYVYMRGPASPDNGPLYNYTLMPTHMRTRFSTAELSTMELAEPFTFTNGLKTMRVQANSWVDHHRFGTLLFDNESDPKQEHPLTDGQVEALMERHLLRLLKESDAPPEQYERLGLPMKTGEQG